eukprot:TRINITY_DN5141_c0_g1_i1.p1 TRINITY_DN5141_c0_g1~~TRINITY_DN5141_c0_g1_i1.p1  ORF type:complete len:186 (-),score=31.56 TRINITY_DN5141_c0_g1_i1:46-603(-)
MWAARRMHKPLPDPIKKWNIIKGDKVQIMSGKDAGKQGVVKVVMRARNRLIVEGLNLVKKHMKSSAQYKGGIFTKESPIHYSNIALIDPSNGKPCKVGRTWLDNGVKARVSKQTGTVIPKPKYQPKTKVRTEGLDDTPPEVVLEKTYRYPDFIDTFQQKIYPPKTNNETPKIRTNIETQREQKPQ